MLKFVVVSNGWSALMRRNLIYRKRHWLATIAECALPVLFCYILVVFKGLAEQSDHFQPTFVPPKFSSDLEAVQLLSMTDYVKALQAKRICVNKTITPSIVHNTTTNSTNHTNHHIIKQPSIFKKLPFEISGMMDHGRNWMVPFLQCDSRLCQHHGEDATQYCQYPKLALAASTGDDVGGMQRAQAFQSYIYQRYPQLVSFYNTTDNNNTSNRGEFIRLFESNQAVEEYTQHVDYGNLDLDRPKIALAIVFTGNDTKTYDYTIRVNSTHMNAPEWWKGDASASALKTTPDTKRLLASFAKQEIAVCGLSVSPLAYPQGPLQYTCTGQYIMNGLLTMQRFLHDWIMVDTGATAQGLFVAEHGVKFVAFPSRPYWSEGFYTVLNGFLPLFLTLGLLYPCASMIGYMAQERETGQKEFLKMMSVTEWQIGSSWFCTFWMLHGLTATVVARVSAPLFAHSDPGLLWLFWQSAFLAIITFASFLPSAITYSAKTATRTILIGLLIVLTGYFMAQAVTLDGGSALTIRILCLHPITAFAYGIQLIGTLEDAGAGATWHSFASTDSPSGLTLWDVFQFLWLDGLLWTALSWYLNRVIPSSEQGHALPWNFPLQPLYWKKSTQQSKTGGFEQVPCQYASAKMGDDIPVEPVSDMLRQQADMGSSVEIHNLSKVFQSKTGSSVTAVDRLNLSLYQGQVTCLLGHNGSGKSTTIHMLTGAIHPSQGFHMVAGKHSLYDMPEIRQELGICLQHNDCLFPILTVREHIDFFLRLKGAYQSMGQQSAEASIQECLQDVGLTEKSHTLAKQLSGGMKRKLCLAVAFSGDSKLVVLDEPTSGMVSFAWRRACRNQNSQPATLTLTLALLFRDQ